jgi:hypothetical protein
VPPSKEGGQSYGDKGTHGGAGFNPGKSVTNHMVNGLNKKDEEGKLNEEDKEP